LWWMRPSRLACSLALGLTRNYLESGGRRTAIRCENGRTIEIDNKEWRVHQVFECGKLRASIRERAATFTNLANLVLLKESHHDEFVHGTNRGAEWLRWIVGRLYPVASRMLGVSLAQPAGPPDVSDAICIARNNQGSLESLRHLREQQPAGGESATRRLRDAMAGSVHSSGPL
jgi:hypothetical protein